MRDDEYNAGWRDVLQMIDRQITMTELARKKSRTPFTKGLLDAWTDCQTLMVKRLIKLQTMDRPPVSDVE